MAQLSEDIEFMTDPAYSAPEASFLYKARVLMGILTSRKAFAGPYIALIGGRELCNYKCVFCNSFSPLVKAKRVNQTKYIDMGLLKRLLNELSKLGTRRVIIGDAEPFMDSRLIEKIELAKKNKLYCMIITNGSLIDREKAERIVDSGLDYLNISVDAGTPKTYAKIHITPTKETFTRIKNTISYIESLKRKKKKLLPHTRLSMVICNRNYHEIVEFMKLCIETHAQNVLFKRMITTRREIADELELTQEQECYVQRGLHQARQLARRHGVNMNISGYSSATPKVPYIPCYYGWLYSSIEGTGDVVPCCDCQRSMGNIKKQTFKEIWNSKKYQEFRILSKSLNKTKTPVTGCNCDRCSGNIVNIEVYNMLHPHTRFLTSV